MRKIITGIAIGLGLAGLAAFTTITSYELKKNTAEVNSLQGLYIFTDCKPVNEYEYLGTVKSAISLGDDQYSGVRDRLIKKSKKEYPSADGLILSLKTGGADMADAIKFK